MTVEDLLWMIGRAALFTSASALTAALLMGVTKIRAPSLHRAVWMLVVVQVWLIVPFVWQVEHSAIEPTAVAVNVVPTSVASMRLSSAESDPSRAVPAPMHLDFAKAVCFVWISGALAMALTHAWRYGRFVRQLRTECCEVDGQWQSEWERQRRVVQLRGKVELRVADHCGPLVCYVPWQFLVVVPRGLWEALARRERSAIVRHELAHLVRGDLWWSLAIRILALPQWFNPLVWLAVQRFDEAGEWACDDWVSCGRRSRELTFARSLVAAAEYATTNSPGALSAQGGRLARRVRRLISSRTDARMPRKLLVLAPLVAILAVQLVRIEFVSAVEPEQITVPDAKYGADNMPPHYVIEPPDVLIINAIKLVPKAPHLIEPLDNLLIRVLGALPDQPIADAFAVDADGKVDLGPTYGRVEVAGLTVEEAKTAIARELAHVLQKPQVSVSLAFSAGAQQITGEHLVAPDGRVNLGIYGTVYVSGMTIGEARKAIEEQLAEYLQDPQVTIDVASYNSKKFYVIMRTGGRGDHVTSASLTGNDRVLDALAKVGNLPEDSSNKIWISRPSAHGDGPDTILPVHWDDISEGKSVSTNYQLLPGDRLFIIGGEPASDGSDPQSKLGATEAMPIPSPYYDFKHPKDLKVQTAPADGATAPEYMEYQIDMLEDRSNALAEFKPKRGNAPSVAVDSETIGPALRALANHKLIHTTHVPKLTCLLGETAMMQTAGGRSHPGFGLNLTANKGDGGLLMEVRLRTDGGKVLEVPAKVGQTVLIRVAPGFAETATSQQKAAFYVAVTGVLLDTPPAAYTTQRDTSPSERYRPASTQP